MKIIGNYKYFGIGAIVISSLVLILSLLAQFIGGSDIEVVERGIAGLLGLVAGILVLKKNKEGLLLSKIWVLLSIPYYIAGTKSGIDFAFAFQTITLNLKFTQTSPDLQSYTTIGFNILGIIVFILLLKVKFPKK